MRTVEVGFRSRPSASGALTWESVHGGDFVPVPDEAAVVTGDGNLIELAASVRYRVASPHVWQSGLHPASIKSSRSSRR